MSEQSATLAIAIRQQRRNLGLTQQALAQRIGPGFHQADISRLERGVSRIAERHRLERVSRALELSVAELLVRAGTDETVSERPTVVAPTVQPVPRLSTHTNTADDEYPMPCAASRPPFDRATFRQQLRRAMNQSHTVQQQINLLCAQVAVTQAGAVRWERESDSSRQELQFGD